MKKLIEATAIGTEDEIQEAIQEEVQEAVKRHSEWLESEGRCSCCEQLIADHPPAWCWEVRHFAPHIMRAKADKSAKEGKQ